MKVNVAVLVLLALIGFSGCASRGLQQDRGEKTIYDSNMKTVQFTPDEDGIQQFPDGSTLQILAYSDPGVFTMDLKAAIFIFTASDGTKSIKIATACGGGFFKFWAPAATVGLTDVWAAHELRPSKNTNNNGNSVENGNDISPDFNVDSRANANVNIPWSPGE